MAVGRGGKGSQLNSVYAAAYTPTGVLWVSGSGMAGTVVGPTTLITGNPHRCFVPKRICRQLSATGHGVPCSSLPPNGAYSVIY